MKRSLIIASMMALAAATFGCSGGGETEEVAEVPNTSALAARVDDWTVTREFIQKAIDALPESQQQSYNTDVGRASMVGKMIEEELFRREAIKEDLMDDPWAKTQIEEATRRILIQGYYRNHVAAEAEPTEKEIHDYYESHEDVYTTLDVCRAKHIFSTDKKKLEDIKTRIVEGGEKFTTMAQMYSEDTVTKPQGGDLGYFNPGGYINGVGVAPMFSDTVFTLERGIIHGPIKWEKGYSLVSITERRPPLLRPYGEVRDEIRQLLLNDRIDKVRDEVVQRIIDTGTYDVHNYVYEQYLATQRSPKELWEFAQNAADPQDRINAFQEIADKFPDDEYAPQALFMVGFVYAEELSDYVTADHKLSDVIRKYPGSEYADMARWMIDNMGGASSPKFEDMDDVNRQMKEDS